MGYLDFLPRFKYTFGTRSIEMSDIFRRIAYSQDTRSNPSNYAEFTMENIDTPDRLASDILNSSNYYWQVLMMNNIISPSELPDDYKVYSTTVNDLENGKSFMFEEFFSFTPSSGDVVFYITEGDTSDTAEGGIIYKYDSNLRKIELKYTFLTAEVAGATVAIYGFNDTEEFVEKGRQKIKKESSLSSSVSYFTDGNRVSSPYFKPSGTTGGTMGNPEGITPGSETLLANYLDGTSLSLGYYVRTILQDYHDKDIEKRNIKTPPLDMAFVTNKNAELLLRNGHQGEEVTETGIVVLGASTTSTTISGSENN